MTLRRLWWWCLSRVTYYHKTHTTFTLSHNKYCTSPIKHHLGCLFTNRLWGGMIRNLPMRQEKALSIGKWPSGDYACLRGGVSHFSQKTAAASCRRTWEVSLRPTQKGQDTMSLPMKEDNDLRASSACQNRLPPPSSFRRGWWQYCVVIWGKITRATNYVCIV